MSLWDGLPKATLPEAPAPVCRGVLPEPAYQVAADKVARKPNPAPALQDRLSGKPEWDGILFEDASFDARGRLVFPVLTADSDAQRAEVAGCSGPRHWPTASCRPTPARARWRSPFALSTGRGC